TSTREAHVLCVRLLLHLKGNTFVQGSPPGCIIYTIPNVQFTEKYRLLLRDRSTNSLDDFVRATAGGGYFDVTSPAPSLIWSNHTLLEWAALRMAWVSCQQYADLNPTNLPATNAIALAAMKNARHAIQIAQTTYLTNGALWVAEAAVCFTERKDQAGLEALQIAVTNLNWSADSANAYSKIAELFENAGLSKLDAANEANNQLPDGAALSIQGNCMRAIHRLMIAAIQDKDEHRFSMLLKLLVNLRRATWSDKGDIIHNSFRRFFGDDDLVKAMAKQLGRNPLPESDNATYEIRRQMRSQIFQDYINLYADQKTVAIFQTQGEDFATEKSLRSEIRELRWRAMMWPWIFSTISGVLSLLALSLFVIALLFEIVLLTLRKFSCQLGKLPKRRVFWIIASWVSIACTAVFANFLIGSGIDSKGGFGPVEPPPLISPTLQEVLIALFLCCAWLGALLLDWKRSKVPLKPWLAPLFFAFAYLVSVFAMAYFRFETVEKITAGLL
ncbi:MAG: hypothetical protein WCS42_19125, partial [Verrucomicrobiota bacterium]